MADFVWQKRNRKYFDNLFELLYKIKLTPVNQLAISANTGTFNTLADNNGFIFVLDTVILLIKQKMNPLRIY